MKRITLVDEGAGPDKANGLVREGFGGGDSARRVDELHASRG